MSGDDTPIGQVIAVAGASVSGIFEAAAGGENAGARAQRIGGLVRLITPGATVYGVISSLQLQLNSGVYDPAARRSAQIELIGEVPDPASGAGPRFQRGVSVYPSLGTEILATSSADMEIVYAKPSKFNVRIGTLHQDASVPAFLMTDDLLGKHFAVLGTTGSGKSCTVTLILRKILEAHPNGHVVLLDPHNEYAHGFRDMVEVIDPSSMQLPVWLLNFEETVALLVPADSADRDSQVAILRDAIIEARRKFVGEREDAAFLTVDTPSPYRLGDLIRILDNAMGKLDKPDSSIPYLRLKLRLETLSSDKRFSFMFSGVMVRDNLVQVLSRLLRIPVSGKPLTVVDLSGVPSEVVEVLVSVMCRMIFDFALWSERARGTPVLLVCEEAHRYVPRQENLGFESTKKSLSRIAKEGRKYGVSLCLVTQRPSELSASILSQCGTIFALRMSNDQDQDFVTRVLPENARSLVASLPALRPQEGIAVGEGVTVPMRIRFDNLDAAHLPRSGTALFSEAWQEDRAREDFIQDTIKKWRLQQRAPAPAKPAG
ncbi:MAG: ATP-binding protein [Pseudomonadota bacterium]